VSLGLYPQLCYLAVEQVIVPAHLGADLLLGTVRKSSLPSFRHVSLLPFLTALIEDGKIDPAIALAILRLAHPAELHSCGTGRLANRPSPLPGPCRTAHSLSITKLSVNWPLPGADSGPHNVIANQPLHRMAAQ